MCISLPKPIEYSAKEFNTTLKSLLLLNVVILDVIASLLLFFVKQFSVDLRDAEIDKAKRRYAATESIFKSAINPKIVNSGESSQGVEFIADNAVNLSKYGQIPSKFDVIFIRHQNLWHDRPTWQKIYEYALDSLSNTGIQIITSNFDREHLLALELLKLLGGNIVVTERNAASRQLDFPGKSIDRHVAAITNKRF